MSVTCIIKPFFQHRQKMLDRYATQAQQMQMKTMLWLIRKAADTEWGNHHGFSNIKTYEQFHKSSPINTYEELKGYIDRMRQGERNILWPGQIKWYAKSSGTTNDKSKFIPVSKNGLKDTHYAGGTDAVVWYLRNNPKSRIFDGKALILGGSHAPNYNQKHCLVGDLSAILIENISPLVNMIRVPKKETALLNDFEIKRERIAHEVIQENVTNLSGVPSWMLSVLTRVMELSGSAHLQDVWPNLEV